MYIVFFLKFGTHNTNLGGGGDSEYLNLLSHERRGFPTNENNRSKGSEARYLGGRDMLASHCYCNKLPQTQ